MTGACTSRLLRGMTLTLALLVVGSWCPPVVPFVAGQKVEIIRGGSKGGATKRLASTSASSTSSTEVTVQVAPTSQADSSQAQELSKKAAALDAKAKALDAKEAELNEREAKTSEDQKRQEALKKQLEKLDQQNRAAWQDATNALAGGE